MNRKTVVDFVFFCFELLPFEDSAYRALPVLELRDAPVALTQHLLQQVRADEAGDPHNAQRLGLFTHGWIYDRVVDFKTESN